MTTETNRSVFAKFMPVAILIAPVLLGAALAVGFGFADPDAAKADGNWTDETAYYYPTESWYDEPAYYYDDSSWYDEPAYYSWTDETAYYTDYWTDEPAYSTYYDEPAYTTYYDEPAYYNWTDETAYYTDYWTDEPAYYNYYDEPAYYDDEPTWVPDSVYEYDVYTYEPVYAPVYDSVYVPSYGSYGTSYYVDYYSTYEYDYDYDYDYCPNLAGIQGAHVDCYPDYDHCTYGNGYGHNDCDNDDYCPNKPGHQDRWDDCDDDYDYCPNKPGNQPHGYDCYPDEHDECPNISGNQPRGYDCYPDHDKEPVCKSFTASDTTIEEGDSTTLHWTTKDGDSASLTGFGSVSLNGSKTVSPTSDKTYVLTVRDDDGDEDTCSVHINVEEEEEDDNLRCELTVSDSRVEEGDRVTLEWDIDGDADYASINEGVGRVDTEDGEERVTVDEDTTYRLTVRNDDDEDTCSVSVRVDEENDFSDIFFEGEPVNNPPPQVVYLSDIPYTGLEDLDPAVLSFWMLLIAAAGMGGWTMYRHGLIPHFAFASNEPIEEGHVEGDIEEGHVAPATENALLASLEAGDTEAAVDVLRNAAVNGAGVEETIAAAIDATEDEALKAKLTDALAAAEQTGVRGAKDVLSA